MIIPLLPVAPYQSAEPIAINNNGQVAVSLYKGGIGMVNPTTALYSNGTFSDISLGGSSLRLPNGINASGEVVGGAAPTAGKRVAIWYKPDGTFGQFSDISSGSTYKGSIAQGINDAGTAVGYSWTAGNGAEHPVYWDATTGAITNMGTLSGGNYGAAYAINSNGLIVGVAGSTTNDTTLFDSGEAFVSKVGAAGMTALPGLTGPSDADDINDAGQIVGEETVDGEYHAFLYSITNFTTYAGIVTDLGVLGAGGQSWADSINALGQIVGYTDTPDGLGAAFLYQNGQMIDLNTWLPTDSGWHLDEAYSINDSGDVVGVGSYNGVEEGFMLTPDTTTPEPSSMALMAAGGLAILAARRKFRRA
jgi:probable HAF family extracellular repeat protein